MSDTLEGNLRQTAALRSSAGTMVRKQLSRLFVTTLLCFGLVSVGLTIGFAANGEAQPAGGQASSAPASSTGGGGGGSAAAPGCGSGSSTQMIIMMVVLFGFMYFFMIRPQQKEAKQREAILKALRKGDVVRTSSGIRGEIVDIDDDEVGLRIADKTKIRILRSAIAGPVTAPEEASDSKGSSKEKSKSKTKEKAS